MGGVGEHVDGPHRIETEPPGHEQGQVAGQGGRVAGDIDDARGSQVDQGPGDIRVHPLPGGIQHHRVGPEPRPERGVGEKGAAVPGEELGVPDAV